MSTPENETPAAPAAPAAPNARTNSLAIATFALAISAFALAGIFTGHIALKQLKSSGESGHGLAKAGLIISYVSVGFGLLGFIIYAGALIAMIAAFSTTGYTY